MSSLTHEAYVYCLLCADGSIYTGVAVDLERRMREHYKGGTAAAAYTRAHGARRLLLAFLAPSLSTALRAERLIKQLKRAQKEELLRDPAAVGATLFAPLAAGALTPVFPTDPLLRRINEQIFCL